MKPGSNGIGSLNEKPLHAGLKEYCALPGDRFEVPVDRFVIDIVRGDLLIEIQTGNFSSIKRKMGMLTQNHRVRLVYPVAQKKWIIKQSKNGRTKPGRRKSPKRGMIENAFEELVSFPQLMADPNFSLEVLLIHEDEVRRHEPGRKWRRKGWATHERRLISVVEHRLFETPSDIAEYIPDGMDEPFTTSQWSRAADRPVWLTRKMAYCMRKMKAIEKVGKKGNSILYRRTCRTT